MLLKTKLTIAAIIVSSAVAGTAAYNHAKLKYKNELLEYQSQIQQQSIALAELNRDKERLHFELQNQIAKSDALRKQKQEVIVKTNTIEVIKYAQSDIAKCEHSVGWVRIHDNAGTNRVSSDANTATKPDDAASGTTDADSLAVIVENYGACNSIREQLLLLQEWVKAVQ